MNNQFVVYILKQSDTIMEGDHYWSLSMSDWFPVNRSMIGRTPNSFPFPFIRPDKDRDVNDNAI